MKLDIVVCRLSESIEWLKPLCEFHRVFIYNKGLPLKNSFNFQEIQVPNIGREGEAYLRHIVNFYDDLSERVVFTQADPFLHSPNFLNLIKNLGEENILPLTYRWNEYLPPPNLVSEYKNSFYLEEMSRHTLAPLKFYDDGMKDFCEKYLQRHNLLMGQDVVDHFCKLINLPDDKSKHLFFYSACFSVTQTAIKSHDKSFYKNCLDLITREPAYGVMFERMWYKIFK